MTIDVDLDHLTEVVLVSFQHCKLFSPLFILYSLEEITMCEP